MPRRAVPRRDPRGEDRDDDEDDPDHEPPPWRYQTEMFEMPDVRFQIHRYAPVAKELQDIIERCHRDLELAPTTLTGEALVSDGKVVRAQAQALKQRWIVAFPQWNHAVRGFALSDWAWIAWAYLWATVSLRHRVTAENPLTETHAIRVHGEVHKQLSLFILRDYRALDTVMLSRYFQELDDLERECVRVTVYFASHCPAVEEAETDMTLTALGFDDDDERIEREQQEEEHRLEKMSLADITREQRLADEDRKKPEEEAIRERCEELQALERELARRWESDATYRTAKFEPLAFVQHATRLFSFIDTCAAFLSTRWTDVVHTEVHPFLEPHRAKIQTHMEQFMGDRSLQIFTKEDEALLQHLFYLLIVRPGAKETYLRHQHDMQRHVPTGWNVCWQDRGESFTQWVSAVLDYDAARILGTPGSTAKPRAGVPALGATRLSECIAQYQRDAVYWVLWCRDYRARLNVQFLWDYAVLQNDLVYRRHHVQALDVYARARLPLVVQVYNAYWIHHVDPHTQVRHAWLCASLLEALYLHTVLVVAEFEGQLYQRLPVEEIAQRILLPETRDWLPLAPRVSEEPAHLTVRVRIP